MADWWYSKNGERQGPVSSSQLRQLAQTGELLPTDMVFKEGASQWTLASTINNLFPASTGEVIRTERMGRDDREEEFDDRDDYDRTTRRAKPGASSNNFVDLLMFRKMIAPTIVIIGFWLGVAGVLFAALGTLIGGFTMGVWGIVGALVSIVFGVPSALLMIRLYAELAMILFRMNETMTEVKNLLEKDRNSKS